MGDRHVGAPTGEGGTVTTLVISDKRYTFAFRMQQAKRCCAFFGTGEKLKEKCHRTLTAPPNRLSGGLAPKMRVHDCDWYLGAVTGRMLLVR